MLLRARVLPVLSGPDVLLGTRQFDESIRRLHDRESCTSLVSTLGKIPMHLVHPRLPLLCLVLLLQVSAPLFALGRDCDPAVPDSAKEIGELEIEEAGEGQGFGDAFVVQKDDDVHVGSEWTCSAHYSLPFPRGEWPSHSCRPPPRV